MDQHPGVIRDSPLTKNFLNGGAGLTPFKPRSRGSSYSRGVFPHSLRLRYLFAITTALSFERHKIVCQGFGSPCRASELRCLFK